MANDDENNNYLNQKDNILSSFFKSPKEATEIITANAVAEDILIIMTEIEWGTLGDYYGAERLIAVIKEKYPERKIQWLIMNRQDSFLPGNAGQVADSCLILKKWDDLLTLESLKENVWLSKAAHLLQFPTYNYLQSKFKAKLKTLMPADTQIDEVAEYDFGAPRHQVSQAGLGENSLGIFIKEIPQEPVTDLLKKLQGSDIGQKLLEDTTIENYSKDRHFFFGYFNNSTTVGNRASINPDYFCHTIAEYASSQDDIKNIDLVCKLPRVLYLKPEEIFKNSNINHIEVTIKSEIHIFSNPEPKPNGKTLRIINTFPYPQEIFQDLISLAYASALNANIVPLIGGTGDQMLSDLLSRKGAIPYYQVMNWKQYLAEALVELSKDYPHARAFFQDIFYTVKTNILQHLTANTQAELALLHDYIIANKDLTVLLPEKIDKTITEMHPHLKRTFTMDLSG